MAALGEMGMVLVRKVSKFKSSLGICGIRVGSA